MSRLFVLTFVAGILLLPAVSEAGMVSVPVPNGSFEADVVTPGIFVNVADIDADLTGWDKFYYNTNNDAPALYRSDAEGDLFYGIVPDGSQILRLDKQTGIRFTPSFTLEEGYDITVSFDALSSGGLTDVIVYLFDIDDNGNRQLPDVTHSSNITVSAGSATEFTTYSYTYTPVAADEGKDFAVALYTSSQNVGDLYLDNVQLAVEVDDVPEPSTIILLLTMVAGLIVFRRK